MSTAANDELIDSYLNREGIKGDTAFLEAELKRAADLFDKLNAKKVTITTQKGISDVSTKSDQGFKETVRLETAIKAVIALVNQRFAAEAKLQVLQVKNGQSTNDYTRETAKLNVEIGKQVQNIKLQAQETLSAAGSIDNMRAKVALLNKERNAESKFTEEGRANIEKLNTTINKYNKAIKESSDDLSKQKINIGNYSGAVSILKNSLADIAVKIDANTKSNTGNKDSLVALEKEQRIITQLVAQQEKGFANATQEIRANAKALFALEEAGLRATSGYKELAKATGKLQDGIADIRARTKALGSDSFVLDGMIQGAQALAGAYGIAQGAAALFGTENEELQKTFVKLQAIMTVIAGLQSLQNGLQAETALMQGLVMIKEKALTAVLAIKQFILKGTTVATVQNIVATEGQAIATNAATVATNRGSLALIGFRAALILSGIGVVVLLLVAAASAMGLFSDKVKTAKEQIEDLSKAFDDAEAALQTLNDTLEFNGKIAIDQLKIRGASELELHQQGLKNIKEKEIKEFNLYKMEQGQIDIISNKEIKRINDLEKAKIAAAKAGFVIKSDPEGDKKKLEESLKDLQKKADATLARKKALEREGELLASGFDVKGAEDGRKKIEDANKKSAAARKAELERQKKAREEYMKREAEAQFDIIKLSIEDRKNQAKLIIDNDKKTYGERLKALTDFGLASQELINAENNKIQKDPKKTTGEKDLAGKKAVIETRDLKIAAEKQLMDIVDANFEKRKESQQKEYDQYLKLQEQKKQLIQDGIDNAVGQQELSLRNQFEIAAAGASAAEKIKLEKKLNEDIEKLRDAAETAQLIRVERELATRRSLMKLFGLDTASIDKLITENEIEQSKKRVANTKKEQEEKKAIREKGLDLFVQVETEAADIISALVKGDNTKEKNKNADKLQALETQKNAEIEAVNASTATAEQKAARITVINAVAQAKKEEIEQRQRRLDMQRAKFERDMGILQIIVSIGVALAKGRYEAAALGGAALIKALATPLPRFRTGKGPENKYSGPAMINDGGKVEPIYRAESGKIEMNETMNAITHVGKNDIVFTSIEDMLTKMAMPQLKQVTNTGSGTDISMELRKQNKLLREIADKPGLQLSAGESGMTALWKHGANRTQYINENTNW